MSMHRTRKRNGFLLLAGGLVVLTVGPLLIPIKPLKNTFPPQVLADEDSQFIAINGLDIHIKKMGQGEPVFLLLHGFASSLYSWHAVMEPLSRLGTVIAYDRIGFGLSERPITWQGQNPYSANAQVEIAVKLLDHFNVQRAILMGNSAGGTVAMQTTLAYPQRVSALILVDPAIYNGGGAPQWMKPILATPQMRRLGPLIARQILKRGPDLIKLAWHNPALLSPEMMEFYKKPYQVENWDKALWEFTLTSKPADLTEQLDEVSVPVLVITGDDDRIVPTKDSIRLAGELSNSSLVVIAESGHVPHEEKPQEFLEAVTNFLNDIQP
jgi:pimeloyl-ACP methyl ester carboxylesterase